MKDNPFKEIMKNEGMTELEITRKYYDWHKSRADFYKGEIKKLKGSNNVECAYSKEVKNGNN